MSSPISAQKLTTFSARRPKRIMGAWLLLLLVAGFFAAGIGDVLTTEDGELRVETEFTRADDLLSERFYPQVDAFNAEEFVILQHESLTVDDPAFVATAESVIAGLQALPAIDEAVNVFDNGDQALVSADRRTTYIPVSFHSDPEDEIEAMQTVFDANAADGMTILTVGEGSVSETFVELSESDLQNGEAIGLPVALIILVVVFGALVAAGIPIIVAIVSIVVAIGTTALVGEVFELSFFVVNMITMIGLAVGIDYSLFIVQRYREERKAGREKQKAIAVAGGTASRAVVFSGATVIVALAGMMIVPDTIFPSLATGAIIVTAVAVLAAMTLLPAMLSLLGDTVDRGRVRIPFRRRRTQDPERGFWARQTRVVMRYPLVSAGLAVALLLAAAVPFLTIELGGAGVATLPEGTEVRTGFDILADEFSVGVLNEAEIVVAADDVREGDVQNGVDRLLATLNADPDFGPPTVETNPSGSVARVVVPVEGDFASDQALASIKRLRADYIPAAFAGVAVDAPVTGATAEVIDYVGLINDYAPIVFAFVFGISFILLMVVFRSIVVPAKALIMNLLSVGAAYGLLVLVFQHGVLAGFFGFTQVETIEPWLPLFLFSILFGLSMDYHVFLLSRIREHFDQTGDNAAAVAFGVRSTAGVITGAALIMVAVFSGFAMGDLAPLQQFGFGLAVAVIIDATIIRSVLVPASMQLLGERNWYLPGWLTWLPHVSIEGVPRMGEEPVPEPAGSPAAGG